MANRPKRVAILGFDCAEPHLIQKHIAEGQLPTFKKLFEGGVLAENCLSPFPTITPPNWASIATGAWPGTHQVSDFYLHRPGTDQNNANVFQAFSSENCKAEYLWDKLDAAGYKCIVCNYPGSWPSKMKNGIMLAGGGLDFDEHRNGRTTLEPGLSMGPDQLVSTDFFPWANRVKFKEAEGWKNLPEGCEDPLDASFTVNFRDALIEMESPTWHVLVTQSEGDGYDRATFSPTKDFKDAFCTLSRGEWSKKIRISFNKKGGGTVSCSFRAKLLELSDDAEEFKLVITRFGIDEGWSNPPELAQELVKFDSTMTFAGGLLGYAVGWYELDTYAEITEFHDEWLGDVVTYLLKNNQWDFYAMHSHPFDWSYHIMLTDMDKATCSSERAYKAAWAAHLRIAQSQDKLLARIVEAAGPDTLFALVSDHGAVADGTPFNPYIPLMNNGLCAMQEDKAAEADLNALDESQRHIVEKFISDPEKRMGMEVIEIMTQSLFKPDLSRSKALPQRTIYIYVNLKGRDPSGIVDPADYEKVQKEIIDALYTYVDPTTGKRPVSLALTKQDARILGLYGESVGDVVYALYPEYGGQHGPQLATTEWGVGKLKALLAFYGPGIKKGYSLERTSGLTDVVPTVCYLMNWPIPADVDGCILYQALEQPNLNATEIERMKASLEKLESSLSKNQK